MLTCKELGERASDYLDSEMNWRDRVSVRLHLMMCKHCRAYMDQLAKTVQLLRDDASTVDAGEPDPRLIALLSKRSGEAS
ncbi:zf-HC2 domain-containing protein [Devosia rhodophyticola]|uniref:Zf-HC2 domain-containing protein n=1 Tax=Devosia rhodophyticola TaxID=3026423 RepID=A0ABY7YZV3_9HYPH|nr:zf-HC2 domain-containing protein [Devosia rhodophyticola]WDR06300.1 zf-HC2 domain-containing protein [Devosia rhodophyticola]